MRRESVILLSLAGATLLLICGGVTAQERLAPVIPTPIAPTFSFGMIGLGTGQTARLNAVNLVRTPPPVAIGLAQPCRVELDLYDDQGKLLKQKTITNLGFGQADFLDLSRSELATTSTHVDVSGAAKVGSNQSFLCTVSTTLEVFDIVTGATNAILANPSSASLGFFTPLPLVSQPKQP